MNCIIFTTATQHTIQMSQRMAEAGADAVMVITPYYFKNAMTNEALEQHFTKVDSYLFVVTSLYENK